jgi:hypothetical protein
MTMKPLKNGRHSYVRAQTDYASRDTAAARGRGFALSALSFVFGGYGQVASAAPDEIQVYTDELNAPGESGLEMHVNYVFDGETTSGYPGERPPEDVLRLTPEISFGLAEHWDWGIYIPMAWDRNGSSYDFDGVKLRLKYLRRPPDGQDGWFYGENVEVGFTSYRDSPAHWGNEFRTIIGRNSGPWQVTLNPIFGFPLSESRDDAGLELEVDLKIKREITQEWSAGIEHYAELGTVDDLSFGDDSGQITYFVLDWVGKRWDLNIAYGRAWTDETDQSLVKAIVGMAF